MQSIVPGGHTEEIPLNHVLQGWEAAQDVLLVVTGAAPRECQHLRMGSGGSTPHTPTKSCPPNYIKTVWQLELLGIFFGGSMRIGECACAGLSCDLKLSGTKRQSYGSETHLQVRPRCPCEWQFSAPLTPGAVGETRGYCNKPPANP